MPASTALTMAKSPHASYALCLIKAGLLVKLWLAGQANSVSDTMCIFECAGCKSDVCTPHTCVCGQQVDSSGIFSLASPQVVICATVPSTSSSSKLYRLPMFRQCWSKTRFPETTENGRMASLCFPGPTADAWSGILHVPILWPPVT